MDYPDLIEILIDEIQAMQDPSLDKYLAIIDRHELSSRETELLLAFAVLYHDYAKGDKSFLPYSASLGDYGLAGKILAEKVKPLALAPCGLPIFCGTAVPPFKCRDDIDFFRQAVLHLLSEEKKYKE